VHKMKYDESYRFEQEGEDVATFQEFRWTCHVYNYDTQNVPPVLCVLQTMCDNADSECRSGSYRSAIIFPRPVWKVPNFNHVWLDGFPTMRAIDFILSSLSLDNFYWYD
jgi:hypothetical protein